MSKFALYVPLEANPGKEKEVADFLRSAVPLVNAEAGTISWFPIQMGPSSFAKFDTFDDEGRAQRASQRQGGSVLDGKGEERRSVCQNCRRFTSSIFSLTSFQNDGGSRWRKHP